MCIIMASKFLLRYQKGLAAGVKIFQEKSKDISPFALEFLYVSMPLRDNSEHNCLFRR